MPTKTISFGDLYAKILKLADITKEDMMKKGKAAFEALQKQMAIGGDLIMPHGSMQLYVAAYYLVQSLDDGQILSTLVGSQSQKPIFLHNYLLLYFILWLLKEGKVAMKLKDSDRLYNALVLYIKDRVDFIQLDLVDGVSLYRAFDLSRVIKFNDNLSFQFIKDVLDTCENVRELSFAPEQTVEEVLPGIFSRVRQVSVVDNVSKMYVKTIEDAQVCESGEDKRQIIGNGNLCPDEKIIMSYSASKRNEALLKFVHDSKRPFSLRLCDKNGNVMIDIGDMIKRKMVELHIGQRCFLFADKPMEVCEHLTHLTFTSLVQFKEDIFSTLCEAVAAENLPNLKYLSFSGCRDSICGRLGTLFKTNWPSLNRLNVADCCLNEEDIKVICAAAQDEQEIHLPGLTSLVLSPSILEISSEVKFLERPWDKLLSLQLMKTHVSETQANAPYQAFLAGLKQGIFPNLVELGTTHWSSDIFAQIKSLRKVSLGITKSTFQAGSLTVQRLLVKYPLSKMVHIDLTYGSLSSSLPYLVCQRFPKVESLVLAHTELSDLRYLSQANAQDRFPSLRYLDVSKNFCFLDSLFAYDSEWKQLQVLHVGMKPGHWDLSCQSIANVIHKKCLQQLKHLHIWFKENDYPISHMRCTKCRSLPENIVEITFEREMYHRVKEHERDILLINPNLPVSSHKRVLDPVARYIDTMKSSSCLEAVHFYSRLMDPSEAEAEKRQIRGDGVALYFAETNY